MQSLAARSDVDRLIGVDVRSGALEASGVEWHIADLSRPAASPDPFDDWVAEADVIHLAWVDPQAAGQAAEANRMILERVLGAVARAGSEPRVLVHLSSGTVYGAWPDNPVPLSEDVPLRPNPAFTYATTKAEAEREVAEWADDHPEVAVSILRPSVVVGAASQPLYQALGGTRLARTDEGGRRVQYLHVDDLASAVVFAWAGRLSGVYNVAPDRGTGEATARALAGGVAQVALPARLAHALADWSWHLVGDGVPKEAQAYARHPWVLAPDRLRDLGWVADYSSEEALVATDNRSHWDDLPPGKRQEFTLLVGVGGLVLAVAAATGAVLEVRRRGVRRRGGA
jgi:UDP-glucose 4-epimerase